MPWWAWTIFILSLWHLIGGLILAALMDAMHDLEGIGPSSFYDATEMNKFGCWLASIGCYMCLPVVSVIYIPLYYVTHIGRDEVSESEEYDDDEDWMFQTDLELFIEVLNKIGIYHQVHLEGDGALQVIYIDQDALMDAYANEDLSIVFDKRGKFLFFSPMGGC